MLLSRFDLAIFASYCVFLIAVAYWVSRKPKEEPRDAEGYFLAGRKLSWWAIGASLIAANISAEQIIGMSGSGYAVGLAIATYEWMAAITLLIVGKFLLPIYLKMGIYTMPQYLEKRFDKRVKMIMAVFWLFVYVFVNLTAILYLGAMVIESLTGISMGYALAFLVCIAAAYSIYGGLTAIAVTDVFQVVLLVFGGLCVTALALDAVSGGAGVFQGFTVLLNNAPEKFDMILSADHPHYDSLPGISVLIGGMWVMHFSYWGFNQYITQRALAAKSLHEARKGILFAAFLKVLMPIIVVVPGIAAYLLHPNLEKPDHAYATMMQLLPHGLLGLTFAALVAAIVSSVGSMANSIATIFSMDIYREWRREATQDHLVLVGRVSACLALIVSSLAAVPLLGNLDQAFQFIQELTGFVTPGVVTLFLFGMFWSKATADGALAAAITSVVSSILLKLYFPALPFIDRVGLVFVLCIAAMMIVSLVYERMRERHSSEVSVPTFSIAPVSASSSVVYNRLSLAVISIVMAFYIVWW